MNAPDAAVLHTEARTHLALWRALQRQCPTRWWRGRRGNRIDRLECFRYWVATQHPEVVAEFESAVADWQAEDQAAGGAR